MPKVLALVSLAMLSLSACGGPHCDDPNINSQIVNGCTPSGDPIGYCQCAADYVTGRYSCSDINGGNITTAELLNACQSCAPQYGMTCK